MPQQPLSLSSAITLISLMACALLSVACEDIDSVDLNAGAQGAGVQTYYTPPPYPPEDYPSAGTGISVPPSAGATSTQAGGTSSPPPFTPPPNARRCEFDGQCLEGQYCYMEYCIDQQPCWLYGAETECPSGYVCVDGLCFEDGGEGSCLSVSPGEVNFGEVSRGDVATQEVTLSACGSAPVSVTQVALSPSSPDTFGVEGGAPLSLSPGQSETFTVSYSPGMVGSESGVVNVVSTDFNNPNQQVRLSATGTPPALEDTGLHVRLEWSTNATDVDLHLLGPNGTLWSCERDCNFSNPTPSWGDPLSDLDDPYLDLDDVDGYGPENINIQTPAPGVYTVVIHYWDDHGGATPLATVHALSYGEVVATIGPEPLNQVGDVWYAFEIEFPGNIVRPLNRFDYSPASVPSCK